MISHSVLLVGISLTALAPLLRARASLGFLACYLLLIVLLGLSPLPFALLVQITETEMLLAAGLINLLAVFRLIGWRLGAVLLALLAACWTASLLRVGVRLELAVLLTLLVPALVLRLGRRPSFAVGTVLREARLLSAALCLGAVFVGEALAGWRQFTALQQPEEPLSMFTGAAVPLLIVGGALAVGVVWKAWHMAASQRSN